MRFYQFYYKLAFVILGFILLGLGVAGKAEAAQNDEVRISIMPKDVLFDVQAGKPGDSAARTINVYNEGRQDVAYTVTAAFKSGSEKLYSAMQVELRDRKKVLYKGDIDGLQNFAGRNLPAGKSEQLVYTVTFPFEAGNEFQGLTASGKLIFQATGDAGGGENPPGETLPGDSAPGTSPGDGNLPDTASGYMNYGLIGLFLIGASLYLLGTKRTA